jgi:hypothetical protein
MDFKEIYYEGMDWIHVAQEREQFQVLVKMVVNLLVP